jgi:hypothetical protein
MFEVISLNDGKKETALTCVTRRLPKLNHYGQFALHYSLEEHNMKCCKLNTTHLIAAKRNIFHK